MALTIDVCVVCGVCIMKFKECFQSSEDLEITTLRSFFFNNQSSFQKTNQLPFLEKAWLHSYGRNASNVHVACSLSAGFPAVSQSVCQYTCPCVPM